MDIIHYSIRMVHNFYYNNYILFFTFKKHRILQTLQHPAYLDVQKDNISLNSLNIVSKIRINRMGILETIRDGICSNKTVLQPPVKQLFAIIRLFGFQNGELAHILPYPATGHCDAWNSTRRFYMTLSLDLNVSNFIERIIKHCAFFLCWFSVVL